MREKPPNYVRFSTSGLFFFVGVVAVGLTVWLNRVNHRVEATVVLTSRTHFMARSELIDRLANSPDTQKLPLIRLYRHPHKWLEEHLEWEQVGGVGVFRIRIVGSTYRDDTFFFHPILQELLAILDAECAKHGESLRIVQSAKVK